MRIYRTTLSCSLRAKGYATYHAGDTFTDDRRWTRHSMMSPSPSYGYRLLHLFQSTPHCDGSAFTLAYILRLRSCRSMGAFIMSPLPPIIGEEVMNSRAPWLHGRYSASSLLRTPPPPSQSSTDFPVDTGYTVYLAPSISRWDEDGQSSHTDRWALLSCHPCLPCWRRSHEQQGPLAPRALLRFIATTRPTATATVSSSADFPVDTGCTTYLAPPISRWDENGFSGLPDYWPSSSCVP